MLASLVYFKGAQVEAVLGFKHPVATRSLATKILCRNPNACFFSLVPYGSFRVPLKGYYKGTIRVPFKGSMYKG